MSENLLYVGIALYYVPGNRMAKTLAYWHWVLVWSKSPNFTGFLGTAELKQVDRGNLDSICVFQNCFGTFNDICQNLSLDEHDMRTEQV